jgi:glycerate 2-kinase
MIVLVAPDSFKDSLDSIGVAESLCKGIKKSLPSAEVIPFPVADGGEGTADILKYHIGGQWQNVTALDSLGREIISRYLYLEGKHLAVIELAKASGLELLKSSERNPLRTNTYGTGQLIRHALDMNAAEIMLAIGGSATVDGGTGLAAALGFNFIDNRGKRFIPVGGTLADIIAVDTSAVHSRFFSTDWLIAADVQNVLHGSEGAARIFGPQKGADPEGVKTLAEGLLHLSAIVKEQTGFDPDAHPGSGAAGGAAFFLTAFGNARIQSGFDIIGDLTGFIKYIEKADLIITGEGSLDGQTKYGKVVSSICRLAQIKGKPVVAVAGQIKGDRDKLRNGLKLQSLYTIKEIARDTEEAIMHTAKYLEDIGESIGLDYIS